MMKVKYFFYITLSVICISLAVKLFIAIDKRTKPSEPTTVEQPDAFAENIKATRYDKTGQIASELTIPKLVHYPQNNVTVFFNPKMLLFYKNQQPWVITSDKGTANQGFDQIVLSGHVILHQQAGINNHESTITTEKMLIDTKSQIATSNEPIHMQQIEKNGTVMIMQAIGIKAFQKTGEIQLLSKVRGEYVPAK
jgi:lipopolysaccharide export system protein LptC